MARRFSAQHGVARVVFGAGASAAILSEIETLGAEKVLVVSTPGRAKEAEALAVRLGSRSAGVLATAREHVPAELVAVARPALERSAADAVLAFGGGSAIGLAKALARTSRVRVIALPTTYSGSEMTPIYGLTEGGKKTTGRDERVRPVLVVYDPELTAALPKDVAIPSLWNAMAHAVEALWAREIDRATLATAEEALRLLARSVERLATGIDDPAARDDALEGAFLAGLVFGDSGGGLHHRLCHVLGGTYSLPHAATHAALLPHVVRIHRDAAPDAMLRIARALGVLDPVAGIERLARASGAPASLRALGMPADGVARVVDIVMQSPAFLPSGVDRESLMATLERASADPPARSEAAPLRGPSALCTQPGLGSTHESEALPGALPRRQNMPRPAPYGLYADVLSGTPFTVRSAENSRLWMYRIRASFSHTAHELLPPSRFASPLLEVDPDRRRWKPLPLPNAPARVDFLDGLVTLGGAGEPSTGGPGYAVHLYAANADMSDRSFENHDGDVLIVPQHGTLEVRTEAGWLRAFPGCILLVPRGLKFAIGLRDGSARGWMLEVFGRRFRLPERGPIGSNGLADARHFLAPTASFEDRLCPAGFQVVTKVGGRVFGATQPHSPFDVVAWHGNHVPFTYDLSLFNAMGSVTWDHPDPSILTVLTAPLDDHGRAVADFVVFPGRWDVAEHSFRPPYMHRNAATEINCVVRTPKPEVGYVEGCTFVSPILTSHGISTQSYDDFLGLSDAAAEGPRRLPDESLWVMFESAMPFRSTAWARETPLIDPDFLKLFQGMKTRFAPNGP
jgi:homogentisate 1,2-dioxygenase